MTTITDKWKSVGAGLRLKPSKLKEIAAAHPGNPADCLSDVVTGWLNKEYNWERFGEPTWRRIVEVVEKPAAGGNPAAAVSIAERHPGMIKVADINPRVSLTVFLFNSCCDHSKP